MTLLRLTQEALDDARYRIEVALEGVGARRTATTELEFRLTSQDREDLRWYLEDYLQWPQDPAPVIAARVEQRIEALGTGLFRSIFESNGKARKLWFAVEAALPEARVEVVTTVAGATSIPWELLREPGAEAPMALLAGSFVRARPDARRPGRTLEETAGPVRILLAICRPDQGSDVPFRSVATRILKGLDEASRRAFDLDVLRPATFEVLARRLRAAKAAGRPYHVLHFDGHGAYLEIQKLFEQWEASDTEEAEQVLRDALQIDPGRYSPQQLYPGRPRAGRHGYLVFENPGNTYNKRLVGGEELSALLVETGVPVLVLNACRSAYAEARDAPVAQDTEDTTTDNKAPQTERALGSLAQELMDSGVGGVVAMRYNLYVVTAARFLAELYASLARGRSLGAAVTSGRKHLHDNPLRELAFDPRSLQDWQVPIVYEAAPIELFPTLDDDAPLTIELGEVATASPKGLDESLPPAPDAGFWGRDETLLALDRAFDTQSLVLLHSYAGSGKTATAAEFARWYSFTGGVEGPVLFSSFEQHTPLLRVLDRVGEVFGPTLERSGVHWPAIIEPADRRQVALQVLAQVPVLWIWDNIEPVNGFPAGSESAWSEEEQQELVDFLRACRDTKAKFLLTSRREETAWLGGLPARISVPPMPMTERLQLTRALATKRGRQAETLRSWRPLLRFSAGNPLALTVLVGQALRDGLRGETAVASFVERLRAGEADFDDVVEQGRSKSLAASLGYGFERTFDEEERQQLALLHLFQGFVDVKTLVWMGDPDSSWGLPEIRGLTRDDATALLDRAAEVGLLIAYGDGYFGIHPALPWFFRQLYEHREAPSSETAERAFVEAMGQIGEYYFWQFERGNRKVLRRHRAEVANLLHARRLARRRGWWHRVTSVMQGLRQLYQHTGRRSEWKRLVEEIVPDFVDPETEGPLPGQEDRWGLINDYRVRLAREERRWVDAERLQGLGVLWIRKHAEPILALTEEPLDNQQRNTLRILATTLQELARIQRALGKTACLETIEEALRTFERIGDRPAMAGCALELGHTYLQTLALRDLDKAELWYRRSLVLRSPHDSLELSTCYNQLGVVAANRLQLDLARGASQERLQSRLDEVTEFFGRALELTPADAIGDLAATHSALGSILGDVGDFDRALVHYREAIRFQELQGDAYSASQTRFNLAIDLANAGRLDDALSYARAALQGLEGLDSSTTAEIGKVRELIRQIEWNLRV